MSDMYRLCKLMLKCILWFSVFTPPFPSKLCPLNEFKNACCDTLQIQQYVCFLDTLYHFMLQFTLLQS